MSAAGHYEKIPPIQEKSVARFGMELYGSAPCRKFSRCRSGSSFVVRSLPMVQLCFLSSTAIFCLSLSRTNVAALNGGLGGTETQTDVLVPSSASLSRSSRLGLDLGVLEDVRLLLVSTLRLDGKLGRHFCDCRWSMVAKVVRWPSWWLT